MITHCRLPRSVCKSRRIVGMATFRIVVSRVTTATAAAMAVNANQPRGCCDTP
jgi:hypothetical protein